MSLLVGEIERLAVEGEPEGNGYDDQRVASAVLPSLFEGERRGASFKDAPDVGALPKVGGLVEGVDGTLREKRRKDVEFLTC